MAKKSTPKRKLPILPIVIVIVLILVCVIFFGNRKASGDGASYIVKQEKLEVSEISDVLKQKRKQERKALIDEGIISVFDILEDYVFYGDSRVMGYNSYNLLEAGRVFATSGNTMLNVDDWDQELKDYNPSTVIISYGANDLVAGLDGGDSGYEGLTQEMMEHVLTIVPNAKIYLCTIIPFTSDAIHEQPGLGAVDQYNNKLKKACDAVDACTLVETSSLGNNGNADIYQGDGIHFSVEFYEVWLNRIIEYID